MGGKIGSRRGGARARLVRISASISRVSPRLLATFYGPPISGGSESGGTKEKERTAHHRRS